MILVLVWHLTEEMRKLRVSGDDPFAITDSMTAWA